MSCSIVGEGRLHIGGLGRIVALVVVALAAALVAFALVPAQAAHAEEYKAATTGEAAATAIERAAAEVRSARIACLKTNAKAFCLEQRASVLEGLIPGQQERSDNAARMLYKLQEDRYRIFDMLLGSQTMADFVAQSEYIDRVTRVNLNELNRTKELSEKVDQSRSVADAAKQEADSRFQVANDALNTLYAQRAERQREGIARAQSEAAAKGGSESVVGGDDSSTNDSKSSASAQKQKETVVLSDDIAALDDGANWYSTQDEFVSVWAPRLDAYLAGSPLAGQGKNFAKSAWKYCIDPRWSAAISNIESGKGRVCIRPHNAWGWGAAEPNPAGNAAEWASWEEAIDAHSKGLANGYGYTITMSGAAMYCPPNWQAWYNITVSQMASI